MMVKLPGTVRVFIGLLLVLAHVALQPGKALSFVLCTEQDGRTIVEFAAAGSCQHPASIVDKGVAAVTASCCPGCSDRILPAEPSPTVASKRGEAPRTVLPTGPPSQDVAFASVDYPIAEPAVCYGRYPFPDADFSDPFLIALRSVRLLT
ncbi:hypothetical protein [Defluviicoccus vanus]|uniref:DUF2946 family protein n=1 Tax=Defluviicoccus vanus TaxID=111831 RepID=A0A7H1N6Z8_9PROT|nr:hypothetical protein [Defluviicoccus vanus]QNT71484.1 hypothetical protein HQ394_19325 [Defluviicoccus vanus]